MDFYFLSRREFSKEQISGDAFQLLQDFISKNYTQESNDMFQSRFALENPKKSGKKVLSKQFIKEMVEHPDIILDGDNLVASSTKQRKQRKQRISPRKDLILILIKKGMSNIAISEELGIQENSVQHYRRNYAPEILNIYKRKVKIICAYCGKEKEFPPHRKNSKYCSNKCYFNFLKDNSKKAVSTCQNQSA